MSSFLEQTHDILRHDLNTEFLATVSVAMAWEYDKLFDELCADDSLPAELKISEFALRRSNCAVRALVFGAKKHGIPLNFRRLECNGQSKLLLKMGRIVLIQEPIRETFDRPKVADYKRELADSHGLIRQLELDLGDQPNRILDWSGSVLAVLLHGAAGPAFSRRDKALGGLMLGVPDSAYQGWVSRLDLHRIAMFGVGAEIMDHAEPAHDEKLTGQQDNVRVRMKSKIVRVGTTI